MNNKIKENQAQVNDLFSTSDFYQLLSASLQTPSIDLVEALLGNSYRDDTLNILDELFCSHQDILEIKECFDKWECYKMEAQQLLNEMRLEYTRLFYHPNIPAINIYETTFLESLNTKSNEALLYVSKEAVHVEKCYREAGLVLRTNEPADHIVSELEFMMDLYRRKAIAIQDHNTEIIEKTLKHINKFEKNHIGKWAYHFFNQLDKKSSIFIYQLFGKIGKAGLKRVLIIPFKNNYSK